MPFPYSATLLDNFNRANNVVDLGPNWGINDYLGGTSNIILSNVVDSNGGDAANYWSANVFTNDNCCFLTVVTPPGGSNVYTGLTVRGSNMGNAAIASFYQLLISGGNAWSIDKVVSGVGTSGLATAIQSISAADAIGFAVIGTSIAAYYSNNGGASWTSPCSVVDTSISAGGLVGLINGGTSPRGHLDDFWGGNAAGAPSVGRPRSMLAGVM